jgi:hypothetical protein
MTTLFSLRYAFLAILLAVTGALGWWAAASGRRS